MFDRRHIPSLSMLLAFESAIRTGSFTKAAEDIGVTQAAISRQVKELEKLLGTRLFEKDGRNVRATSEATTYYNRVKHGLQEIAEGTKFLLGQQGSNAVRLAVLPTTSSRWLVPRLSTFIEEYPNVSVVLSIRVKPFDFVNEDLDAAIHCGTEDWQGVQYDLLGPEEVAIVCAPRLIEKRSLKSRSDLLDFALVSTNTRQGDWTEFFRDVKGYTKSNRSLEFETFSSAIKAAASGLGIAIVPTFLIEDELKNGDLVIAFGEKYLSNRNYYLVYPKGRLDYASFRNFRLWLISQARNSMPAPH